MTRIDIIEEYVKGIITTSEVDRQLGQLTSTETLFYQICKAEKREHRKAQKKRILKSIRKF